MSKKITKTNEMNKRHRMSKIEATKRATRGFVKFVENGDLDKCFTRFLEMYDPELGRAIGRHLVLDMSISGDIGFTEIRVVPDCIEVYNVRC